MESAHETQRRPMTAGDPRQSVTQILASPPTSGEQPRMDRLLPLIYDELRQIARRHLAKENERYTLCTTGLVHEAYLKLVDDANVSSRGKSYFFAAVAHTMRRIVVDHARARRQLKRGGDVRFTAFDGKDVAVGDMLDHVVDLDAALARLAELSPRQVQIVECRVFGGLDVKQTAEGLGISTRTVKRDWAVARAWLLRALRGAD